VSPTVFRELLSRLRDRIAVEDADERIEGSGEPIVSPQHRRSAAAERALADAEEVESTDRLREGETDVDR